MLKQWDEKSLKKTVVSKEKPKVIFVPLDPS